MSDVVSINSGLVSPKAGEVHEPLVNMLESLLEKAKSGEIQGVSAAYIYSDGTETYWTTTRVTTFGLIGALEMAKLGLLSHDDG